MDNSGDLASALPASVLQSRPPSSRPAAADPYAGFQQAGPAWPASFTSGNTPFGAPATPSVALDRRSSVDNSGDLASALPASVLQSRPPSSRPAAADPSAGFAHSGNPWPASLASGSGRSHPDQRPTGTEARAASSSGANLSGGAASAGTRSNRPSVHELGIADKISQADFDAIADALDSGMSARAAVRNADTGIPHSTVRRWLLRAGVGLPTNYSWSSLSAMSAMSAHQIRTAMTAHADYVRRQGKTMGSAKAAYMTLGGTTRSGVSFSTFRDYFNNRGLSAHGRSQLKILESERSSGTLGSSTPDRRSVHELGIADKISQADFDAIADAVDSGMTSQAAILNADTVPESTVRSWLHRAGVALAPRYTRISMSAHQIRTAMTAHADYVSRQGTTRGSADAAYMALGGGVNRSTFQNYFNNSGLTDFGQIQLRHLDSKRSSGTLGSSTPDAGR